MIKRLVGVLALCVASLYGAAARISSTVATFRDGAGVTTSALNTTGASLLVVGYSANRELSTTVVSDSKGNTWRSTATYNNGGVYTTIYYAWDHGGSALSVGTGHTVSVSQTGYHGAVTFAAYSGTKTTVDPYDQHNGATTSASTIQPGSITPTANGSVLVLGVGIYLTFTSVSSVNSSYSLMTAASNSGEFSNTLADLIQAAVGAINPTVTLSGDSTASAISVSFLAAPPDVTRRKGMVTF